jgi:hypothetical protein
MAFENSNDWQKIVKNKWLIFDAGAIISIIEFGAEDLSDTFLKLKAKLTYIHPVLLELMNTDSTKSKIKRNEILDSYDFEMLALREIETKLAAQIQNSLPINIKSKPSSTDFYLGGTLARYANSNAYLMTSNTKDFPKPIYTREGFIILHNNMLSVFRSLASIRVSS